jgi:pantothenate kinase
MYEEVLELDGMDLEDLRSSMDEAIVDEEYEKAAFLRDKIHELENNDPVLSLERDLKLAVEEERYVCAMIHLSCVSPVFAHVLIWCCRMMRRG